MIRPLLLILFSMIIITSCDSDENYTPKPKGYPRIHIPTLKSYKVFDNKGPYTFEYPDYAKVVSDTNFLGQKPENPWWVNVTFPSLNAIVHLSYKPINHNKKTFFDLVEDTYQLTFKHSVKAEAIDKSSFHPSKDVSGQMFLVRGNAASSNQFYITDSTNHFVRGSLYFYCEPNEDSLAPATKVMFENIEHIIGSMKWKK